MLAIYKAPTSPESIDRLRYAFFVKSTKQNKPVKLSNQPPISAAAYQHYNRVYYQVKKRLKLDLETHWGKGTGAGIA